MTREEALDKLCHSYSGYFDVVRHEEPKGYLVAEAGLHRVPAVAAAAIELPESAWSNLTPAFALCCVRHETQYSRLFRS